MTNIFGRPGKHGRKKRLFEIGIQTLEGAGYDVEKVPGIGKSSVRRVTREGRPQMLAIRTTQDRWLSFPRNEDDTGWGTLEDVDQVMVVSVDSAENPRFGLVHLFDQADITARFDRALKARRLSGRKDPTSHGMWISLYQEESEDPSLVGAGAGLASPPIAQVPIDGRDGPGVVVLPPPAPLRPTSLPGGPVSEETPLTIPEAKRRLAITLGVDPSAIKISVEA